MSTASDVDTQKLIEDLKTLVRDGGVLLRQGKEDLTDTAREARARLGAALEAAQETIHHFEEKTISGAKATDRLIRDHPYQTLGVAFGVGLLLGVFLHRGK